VPITSTKEIVDRAFAARYGVGAFNIVDDLSIDAVLAAAEEERAPVIMQTSVKTVKAYGRDRLLAVFRAMAADTSVPVALHLDHCPDLAVIDECIEAGWNSVLYDAHELPVSENLARTIDLVQRAHGAGVHVEGEIEGIEGKEDDLGSDEASASHSLEVAVDFIQRTGVDIFAPAIGNAHGQYRRTPRLDHQRVSDLVEATGVPMALHGGTGLSAEAFTDLIARGCAKVNISTALKEAYMRSALASLTRSEATGTWDPPTLFADQRAAVVAMAREHIALFGGSGMAW
jgi:fructose-bisphosphate aldolase class II